MRYECQECGHRTFYRKPMKFHIKSKHKEANAPFLYLTCTLCTKENDHKEHHYTKSEYNDKAAAVSENHKTSL